MSALGGYQIHGQEHMTSVIPHDESSEPVVALRDVCQRYGKKTILDIPSLKLESGIIYAVLGSNGSGKSTLAKIISGVLNPTRGQRMVRSDSRAGIVSKTANIGYMPQKSYAFYGTVEHNIRLGCSSETEALAPATRAATIMDDLGLTHLAHARAKSLSGGETARLALARVLVGSYDALVLDEPTASLDVEFTLAAEKLIGEYRDKHDAMVFLITHSISQAERISDQILFLDRGHIREQAPTAQVLSNPQCDELRRFIEVLGR